MVIRLTDAKSVVDFGCGLGAWLQAFAACGIEDYLGIDGSYVDLAQLRIPQEKFCAGDLRSPIRLDRKFDIACAMEVAEHLPEAAADAFVATLVQAAPRVLFSAAIPGQGGTGHLNEQWQSYWARRFAARGYATFDCIRPEVYGNASVEWWYQQNTLLFCLPESAPPGFIAVSGDFAIDRAHPQFVQSLALVSDSGRKAISAIGYGLRVLSRKAFARLGVAVAKKPSWTASSSRR